MKRWRVLSGLLALVTITSIAAFTGEARAAENHAAVTVTVTATEFKFRLSPTTLKAGTVTFNILNKGKLGHDFQIAGKKTPVIAPGKSARLTVTLKKGSYPYSCTVAGHAKAGMKGVLAVTA